MPTKRPHAARWLCAGALGVGLVGCSSPAADPAPGGAGSGHVAAATPGIDETRLVTLAGNTHPEARAENDLGVVDDALVLEHMQLVLKRSPEREAALEAHIDSLHDNTSPRYHQWLTVQQLADLYAPTVADVATVTSWLTIHGFHVDSVPTSRMFIELTGTAAQIRDAFHTEIHHLDVRGIQHLANMSDPAIPVALAPIVAGIHALHDFMPHTNYIDMGMASRSAATGQWSLPGAATGATPAFTFTGGTPSATYQAVAPADFDTIYNVNPLLSAGITGAGQTVVVIEDTLLKTPADVATFRAAFGLSAYPGTFSQVVATGTTTCTSPGVNAAEGEASLDAEWAGASAPGAAIELAACKDTTTVFGGLIALQNILNGANPPPIVSISYGECESANGAAANTSYVTTYEQAAAMGISVFVSTGDEGAASCDANKTVATHGIAVSGFASTPYNVAVGGTDFMDLYDSKDSGPALSTYWSATNGPTFASALSYIPETTWNDSCASKLVYTLEGYTQGSGATGFCNSATGKADFRTTGAASGGPSTFSAQPTWQTGVFGLPTKSGGQRYLPDVSLFASNGVFNHFYVYCMTDTAQQGGPCTYTNVTDALALAAGGTSFASPAMAGIQALINQKMGGPQGNPNPTLYKLAAAEYGARGSARCNSSGGTVASPVLPQPGCIFNDVTAGDIDVNCTGATDCFGTSGTGANAVDGALSVSSATFTDAYAAGTGWDFATGLGTVNAYNLVTAWSQ